MNKNVVTKLVRVLVILVLLYISYYVYITYTYKATQMMDYNKFIINKIIHYLIFFIIGITLSIDTKILQSLKNRTLKIDFVNLSISVVLLIILLCMKFVVYMYTACFIAFLVGYFLMQSFNNKKEI